MNAHPGAKPTVHVLMDRLRAEPDAPKRQLRFSLSMGKGWVQGDEQRVRLCADLYNCRDEVLLGLRLLHAFRSNPDSAIRAEVGGCTCLTKTPDPAYHSESCVYAAVNLACGNGYSTLGNPHGEAE